MKYRALAVGVDNYADPEIRNLEYACADADAVGEALQSFGFRVQLLKNPVRTGFEDALRNEFADLARGDVFVLFFAGHGFSVNGGQDRLFFADDQWKMLRHSYAGVPFDVIREYTDGKGVHLVFLLDACRSDFQTGVRGTDIETRDLCPLRKMAVGEDSRSSVSIFRSCKAYQYSRELPRTESEPGHGLFTAAFLRVLEGARAEKGRIRFDCNLCRSIAGEMGSIIRERGYSGRQEPEFEASGDATVVLDPGGKTVELVTCSPQPGSAASMPFAATVVCSKCGKRNVADDTFKCLVCGDDFICQSHYSSKHRCCEDCARKLERDVREPGTEMGIMLPHGVSMQFCWCPATVSKPWRMMSEDRDYFMMGSPDSEAGRHHNERLHRVTLTSGFWIGKYPVTQRQWLSIMDENPSSHVGDDLPVVNVSWNACEAFMSKINKMIDVGVALPTEAQWEYACRAGTNTPFNFGRVLNGDRANCDGRHPYGTDVKGTYVRRPSPVGKYVPNPWGIYDMHGNVCEWCADLYAEDYGPLSDVCDPQGAETGTIGVCRGGGFISVPLRCRSAARAACTRGDLQRLGLGLRLVCCI